MNKIRPLMLIILDGWGERSNTEANAITAAHKPYWDTLMQTYPHTVLDGSGHAVGLPTHQMGNSEVGHLNMGAGRIVYQDLTRIDLAIEEGSFFQNEVLSDAFNTAKDAGSTVHVMGLLSPGGVHSHENHIQALIKMAAQFELDNLYFHAFLDGRDTPPKSALASLLALEKTCQAANLGKIASLVGRYFAMDRDKRWDRIERAYNLLVLGETAFVANSAAEGLELAYQRGETDEFVQPTSIHELNKPAITIKDGDVVIFMNFRADRARELTSALTNPQFKGFDRKQTVNLAKFVCLSQYDKNYSLPVAFPPQNLTGLFAEVISKAGLKQLRIAETEKYAHVTFFFNGGVEEPFPAEERILIPSPKVATYDLLPEMSAPLLAKTLVAAIESDKYDVIICNFANPDMVGHTGNFDATVKAIEAIDQALRQIIPAAIKAGGEAIITADHGNAEQMFDSLTNQPHTAHTSDPVPFIYIGRPAQVVKKDGKLSDIAPTLLYLLGIQQPEVMTGSSIVQLS